jgi:acetyl esterase/lipase
LDCRNFENHKRLLRDLVVGSSAAVVFVEYTPIPDAVFPTQIEQNYAAASWVAKHGAKIGVDGGRMALAGNSVGGDMSAVLALMAKDRGGPKIRLQVLLIPATDTNFETESYRDFDTGRFLARAFMQYGWKIYAPDQKTRKNPYVAPLQASTEQLRGLPPALVITAENDPLRDDGALCAQAQGSRRSRDVKPATIGRSTTSSSSTRFATCLARKPPSTRQVGQSTMLSRLSRRRPRTLGDDLRG